MKKLKLTEQEERIVIQSSLMGLTVTNMRRIVRHLENIEREREQLNFVQKTIQGKSYKISGNKTKKYTVTLANGKTYQASRTFPKSNSVRDSDGYNITITEVDGKQDHLYNITILPMMNILIRQCPENDRILLKLLSMIDSGVI